MPDDPSNMLAACQAALTGSYKDTDYTAMTPVTVSSADAKIDAAQTAIRKDCTPGILFINPFTMWAEMRRERLRQPHQKLKNSLSDRDLQQIQVRDSKIHIDPATGRLRLPRRLTKTAWTCPDRREIRRRREHQLAFPRRQPLLQQERHRHGTPGRTEQHHGRPTRQLEGLADAGGAFIFLLSGLVNLVIWGIGFSLLRILATVMSYLMSGLGIFLGLLLYALMPERGGRALANAAKRLGAMCATSTAIGIVAMIIVVINNALMAAFNVIDMNGNSSANVLTMGMCTLLLPPASVLMLRYLCREVWRFGDLFSRQGFMRLIGGTPVMNGMGRVSGRRARHNARHERVPAGGLLAGGGIMAAMGAAGAARRSPRRRDHRIRGEGRGRGQTRRLLFRSARSNRRRPTRRRRRPRPPKHPSNRHSRRPNSRTSRRGTRRTPHPDADRRNWTGARDGGRERFGQAGGRTGTRIRSAAKAGDRPQGHRPRFGHVPTVRRGHGRRARTMAKERTTSSGTDTLAPRTRTWHTRRP
ncbi:MAG: hypothetical protein ACLRL4_10560 [Bifidobacterium bifidum]